MNRLVKFSAKFLLDLHNDEKFEDAICILKINDDWFESKIC